MKFLADIMVCNLARWLRILGFDTACAEHGMSDSELVIRANQEERILLTRDKKLASKPAVFLLRSTSAKEQLLEIKKAFNLETAFPEKIRCAVCNGELVLTEKEKIKEQVPEKVVSDVFWLCKSCGKAYWRGSHWRRIEEMAAALKS